MDQARVWRSRCMRVHGEPLPPRAGAQSGQRVAVDTRLPSRSGTREPAAQAHPAGVSGIGWQAGVSRGLCAWCGCGIPREGPRCWSDVPDRPRGRQTPAPPPLRACRPLEVSELGRALPLPLRPLPLLLPLALARPSCPWGSLALGGLGLGARRAPGGTRGLSLPPRGVKMRPGQGQEGVPAPAVLPSVLPGPRTGLPGRTEVGRPLRRAGQLPGGGGIALGPEGSAGGGGPSARRGGHSGGRLTWGGAVCTGGGGGKGWPSPGGPWRRPAAGAAGLVPPAAVPGGLTALWPRTLLVARAP